MTNEARTGETPCPRCGVVFRCGARDAAPCACTVITTSEALRTELRARFTGCLCPRCLADLAGGTPSPSGEGTAHQSLR